jgi:hypothetical protein
MNFKKMGTIGGIFFGLITTYALFLGASHEALRGDYDFFSLPFNTVFQRLESPVKLKGLFQEKKREFKSFNISRREEERVIESNIYIFVLDKSQSIQGRIKKLKWYDKIVERLISEDYIPEETRLKKHHEKTITTFDAAEVCLYGMLVDLAAGGRSSKDSFAIWTVGNYGKRIFPDWRDPAMGELVNQKMAKVTKANVLRSIKKVQANLSTIDINTDFKHLFDKIWEEHEDYLEIKKKISPQSPSLIITILSDQQHDVSEKKAYIGKEAKINKNWEDLKDRIKELSNAKIMANMIVVTKDGRLKETTALKYMQIFEVFKKFYRRHPHLLEKKTILEDIHPILLFPKIIPDSCINFYYESDVGVINDAKLLAKEDTNILIQIPSEINSQIRGDVIFKWEIKGADSETPRDEGILDVNQEYHQELLKNQMLQLTYTGSFSPKDLKRVRIWITHEKSRKSALVDVNFIKKLPFFIAVVMLVLELMIILLLIIMSITALKWLLNRPQRPGRVEEDNPEDSPEIKQIPGSYPQVEPSGGNQNSERPTPIVLLPHPQRPLPIPGVNEALQINEQIIGRWIGKTEILTFLQGGFVMKKITKGFVPYEGYTTEISGTYKFIGECHVKIDFKEDTRYMEVLFAEDRLILTDETTGETIQYRRER